MIKLFPVLKSDDEPNIFMVSKEKTHSLTKWVIYYITFSESRYKHSISSWDNPVACEITSIATPNFFNLRALSLFFFFTTFFTTFK